MKPILTLIVLTSLPLLVGLAQRNQVRVLYHEFEPTESTPILTRWNIHPDDSVRFYIKETYDSKNRVLSIGFYDHAHLYTGFTCFETPLIRFSYARNRVEETHWSEDKVPYQEEECGVPYKTEYLLDDSLHILKTREFFLLPGGKLREVNSDKSGSCIWYYYYSAKKLNGTMPISRVRKGDLEPEPPYRIRNN